MHNTLKKPLYILTFIIISIMIPACKTTGRHISINEKKYETNSAIIEIQMPEFLNLGNSELEASLNEEYNSYFQSVTNEFIKKCPDETPEKYSLRISQNISCDTNNFLSLTSDIYELTDDIHAARNRLSKTIDISNKKEIMLSDLFSDDGYIQKMNKIIEKIIENNPEEYNDLWEKPVLSSMHNTNFYISDKGIIIYYPPYELSYYARGFVEFCIPYKELSGYFKPEYNFLIQYN